MRGLAAYAGAPPQAIRGATRQAMASLIELCLEERVGLLVIAGDIFDGDWKDFSTGLYLRSQLGACARPISRSFSSVATTTPPVLSRGS